MNTKLNRSQGGGLDKTKTGLDGGSVRLRGGFDCTRAFGRVLGADHNKQLFKLDFNFRPPPPLAPQPDHVYSI